MFRVGADFNRPLGVCVEFKNIEKATRAIACAKILTKAFPLVDVIDDCTGQVIYSCCVSTEHFEAIDDLDEVLWSAEQELYDF